MSKTLNLIGLTTACLLNFLPFQVFAQYQEDNKGYVLMQAENTTSPLGLWKSASTYTGRTGSGHLEFTGNNTGDGPATSPLEYQFTISQAGEYLLYISLYNNLQGAAADQCNDVYVRMAGDFSEANGGAPLATLKQDTKLFGGSGSAFAWSLDPSLEPSGTTHIVPKYNFKAGQTYTLTVSGRSLRTVIDRILLTTANGKSVGQNPSTPESSNQKIPVVPKITFKAIGDFIKIPTVGFANYSEDPVSGSLFINSALLSTHNKWAAAEMVFKGEGGNYDFWLHALKETDGETSYKVYINGKQVGPIFKNESINLDSRRDKEIQTHFLAALGLKPGDVIRVESNCTSNSMVPQDSLFAFAKGQWVKIEIAPKFASATFTKQISATASVHSITGKIIFANIKAGDYSVQFYQPSGHLVGTRRVHASGKAFENIVLETRFLTLGRYFIFLSGSGISQFYPLNLME